jgi:threonine dehydratase
MRKGAAANKVAATRAYGANVDLFGDDHLQAFDHAHDLEREQGYTFVPPYDDPMVIAGTGTVGAEILEDLPDPDVVIVPIGGGGLISGVALTTKLRRPQTRVIGVEPQGAQTVTAALAAGKPVTVSGATIADGLAAPFTGALNLAAIQRYVDEVVLVSDDEIRAGMRMLLERAKALAEPAGAAGLAALLAGKVAVAGKKVIVIVSGGNVDVAKLPELLA